MKIDKLSNFLYVKIEKFKKNEKVKKIWSEIKYRMNEDRIEKYYEKVLDKEYDNPNKTDSTYEMINKVKKKFGIIRNKIKESSLLDDLVVSVNNVKASLLEVSTSSEGIPKIQGKSYFKYMFVLLLLFSIIYLNSSIINFSTTEEQNYTYLHFTVPQKINSNLYRISMIDNSQLVEEKIALLKTKKSSFSNPNSKHKLFVTIDKEKRKVNLKNGYSREVSLYHETSLNRVPALIKKYHNTNYVRLKGSRERLTGENSLAIVDSRIEKDGKSYCFKGLIKNNTNRNVFQVGVYIIIYTDKSKSKVLTKLHNILVLNTIGLRPSEMAPFVPNPIGSVVKGHFYDNENIYSLEDLKYYDVVLVEYKDNQEFSRSIVFNPL